MFESYRSRGIKGIAFVMAILIAASLIFLSETAEAAGAGDSSETAFLSEKGVRIGVEESTIQEQMVRELYPDAEILYYPASADLVSALETGKIDGFVAELPVLLKMMQSTDSLTYFEAPLKESGFGFVFPKTDAGKKLNDEFSGYIKNMKADGSLKQTEDIWFGKDEDAKDLFDYTALPDDNGTLVLATSGVGEPFTYMKDGRTVGYDIDIAAGFCREYGYRLEVQTMDFNGIIPSVQTGKTDFGASAITITEERAESVDFSEPYYTSQVVMAVLKKRQFMSLLLLLTA